MELKFRELRADEVECRVGTVSKKGCSLLLYKDARCDQNILDESVGAMNWQRHHSRDNANCIVSIWDSEKQQWIEKEDTGTESFTEKEKGLASDSFKRACFNWGLGRALYTAPFIWIKAGDVEIKTNEKNGRDTTYDRFSVSKMVIENSKIVALEIINESMNNKTVFTYGNVKTSKKTESPVVTQDVSNVKITKVKADALTKRALVDGVSVTDICKANNVDLLTDLTEGQFAEILHDWSKKYKKAAT